MSSPSTRMERVRGRDTAPEMVLRRALWSAGVRYRLQALHLPGTPDIVISSRKLAVFVHGCFWHRHEGCPRSTTPKTNRSFWEAKFAANVTRDERKRQELVDGGWTVFIAWECELGSEQDAAKVAASIVAWLRTS
jgi:DNA mismatch endonuclease, patch repair protein